METNMFEFIDRYAIEEELNSLGVEFNINAYDELEDIRIVFDSKNGKVNLNDMTLEEFVKEFADIQKIKNDL